jgi:hypothetical protein
MISAAMRKYAIQLLCFILVLTGVGASTAAAQVEDAATRWGAETDADYSFGQFVTLTLRAEPGTAFRRATLFLKATSLDSTFTQDFEPATAPSLAAGQPVDIAYRLDLDFVDIAPFATVTYRWELESAAGAQLTTPEQSFAYDDDRFEWRRLSTPSLAVHWTDAETRLGQSALEIVRAQLAELQALIPAPLPAPLRVYLYPSAAELRTALRLADRDWVNGHTDPALGVILVTAVNPRTAPADLQRSLPHELTHLLLFQRYPSGYDLLPFWLNEGLATIAEAEPSPNQALLLNEALREERTLPLAALCAPHLGDEMDPALAFAQSASLVTFIRDQWGDAGVIRLLEAQVDSGDCSAATEAALGLSLSELEQDWLTATAPGTSLRRLVERYALWLLFLVAGFGGMLLLAPRPRRLDAASQAAGS